MLNLPIVCTQVTLRGNMGYLDSPVAAQLFTFGRRGRVLHSDGREWSQKSAKIGEDNGMPSLPTGTTQIKKTGNVGSVDVFRPAHLFTFGPRGKVNALRGS